MRKGAVAITRHRTQIERVFDEQCCHDEKKILLKEMKYLQAQAMTTEGQTNSRSQLADASHRAV